jgi:predicted GTPase
MHLLLTLLVLTRDRKYGDATYQNKSFIVVDTGVLVKMKVVLTI